MTTLNLAKQKFEKADFSGQDLRGVPMDHSLFHRCSFDRTNMAEVDCTGSDFTGSSFRGTNLYRTNMRDCKLRGVIFEPKDAFGMCWSLTCDTFQGLQMSQLWYYAYLLFGTMIVPAKEPVREDLQSKLIACIGAERYIKLKELFRREM